MTNYRYRALTQTGDIVTGSIAAASVAEVFRQVEYLGQVPIEAASEGGGGLRNFLSLSLFNKPRPEDIDAAITQARQHRRSKLLTLTEIVIAMRNQVG